MYMIHLSSILVRSCINITQISFHQFFQRILLKMFKHTITQQEMLKITASIKQNKKPNVFRLCNLKLWTFFPEFFGQNFEILQNNQTLSKSAESNFTIWVHLISFRACLVYCCVLVSVCIWSVFLRVLFLWYSFFVNGIIDSDHFGLLIISPISYVCFYSFFYVYMILKKLWYDIIWYDIWKWAKLFHWCLHVQLMFAIPLIHFMWRFITSNKCSRKVYMLKCLIRLPRYYSFQLYVINWCLFSIVDLTLFYSSVLSFLRPLSSLKVIWHNQDGVW